MPATGRNLECIPHRLAAGTLRRTGTPDDHANKGLFRYVISSNGARVTDIRERKNIFRASVKHEDALTLLEKCRGKGLGIASHVRHRYLLQGRFLTTAGLLIYGKDAKGVYCVRDMEDFIRRNDCEVEEFQFYFLLPGAKEKVKAILKDYPSLYAAYTGIYVEVYSEHASKEMRWPRWQDISGSDGKKSRASVTAKTICQCLPRPGLGSLWEMRWIC